MNLKSLLLCSDEKIGRVLRRTLGDLDIGVEHCTSAEVALRHLTRDRFEAIIVDCAGPGAADVLRAARTAPCNKRAIAVAILDPGSGLRSAFEIGAHFILYKPVSAERAKSSFRAARALMKRERRRNSRVSVNFPVEMVSAQSGTRIKANTTDVGEGGLAVSIPRRTKPQGQWQFVIHATRIHQARCRGRVCLGEQRYAGGLAICESFAGCGTPAARVAGSQYARGREGRPSGALPTNRLKFARVLSCHAFAVPGFCSGDAFHEGRERGAAIRRGGKSDAS